MLGIPSLDLLLLLQGQRRHLVRFDAIPQVFRELDPLCRRQLQEFLEQGLVHLVSLRMAAARILNSAETYNERSSTGERSALVAAAQEGHAAAPSAASSPGR